MDYLIYILLLLVVIYISSLISYIFGNLVKIYNHKSHHLNPVSIIIAVKNGEQSLPNILNDLNNQNYDGESEYIIVDDQSTDKTPDIIREYSKKNDKFIYVSSREGNQELIFKKRALDAGIQKSKHDILIFTDVDCRVKKGWVKSMALCFQNQVDYVVGVSEISSPKNLISRFQKIDLMMMMTAGRAACNLEKPIASTGQNQAYKKYLYYKNEGFIKIKDSIQGDDSLFMQLCVKNDAYIKFNDDINSFVESRIETNLNTFIKQRIRWAADAKVMWRYNKEFFIILLATFFTNLILLLSPIIFIFIDNSFLKITYILFFIKFIFEFSIYIIGNLKLKNKFNALSFIIWYILEIPYVVIAGIGSFFMKNIKWRGQLFNK